MMLACVVLIGCASVDPNQSARSGNEQWADVPISVYIENSGDGQVRGVHVTVSTHGQGESDAAGGRVRDTVQTPTTDVDADLDVPLVP